ncbi:MAG: hypothetical protein QW514_06955 [Thermoprotei archaeon]
MMRVVEVILAVGILAVGIAGINIYLYTQPADVQPQNLSTQAYTTLTRLEASGPLTCSAGQKQLVLNALYVLLPPTIHYNFTVYKLVGHQAVKVYTLANAGQSPALYRTSVTVAINTPITPQQPGSKLDVQPVCIAVLTLGEP